MELEERYGQLSGIRVYRVKKERASISQGSMRFPEYYVRMKSVWDELSTLTVHTDSHWTCGGSRLDIQKREENQRFYQFLMGLNNSYSNARTNLLTTGPFSTINKAYSLLVNNERQREIQHPLSYFSLESASFSVGVSRSTFHPKTTFDPRRPNVVYSYCNKPGIQWRNVIRNMDFPQTSSSPTVIKGLLPLSILS
ncbi:uncharacterized protein [Nicotiana tomentosiformis]|uniref:uncharacterized protein n=1 Tax=Nicotiana tomentosiformis TaxID=4098 RepID=UPI00144725DB|nr:uncharacterized protein LOC117274482 [Nicotiana tomentosiformis]